MRCGRRLVRVHTVQAPLIRTDHAFLLPVLLGVIMVLVSHTRRVQCEIERMADTEERLRSRTIIDALTGLPKSRPFLGVWQGRS